MISVIGLLPAQANIIEKEFKGRIDITFWDARRTATLKPLCHNSDAVFMRTKHANHRVYQSIKKYGANIIHVNGGLDSLKTAIETYLEGRS